MKCLKNNQTGQITRVSDFMAHLKVKNDPSRFSYCSRSEWRASRKEKAFTDELAKEN